MFKIHYVDSCWLIHECITKLQTETEFAIKGRLIDISYSVYRITFENTEISVTFSLEGSVQFSINVTLSHFILGKCRHLR